MSSKGNALIEKLIEKYGTGNHRAAIAAQAIVTIEHGENEKILFDMIECEEEGDEE